MPKFIMTELVDLSKVITARLGAGTGAANNWDDKEVGKFVKQTAESRYELCAIGDEIEGRVNSVETSTQDGYSIGGVMTGGRFEVVAEGLQATGTGNLAVGDYVVAGTPVAKGTALTEPAKVRKGTQLTFATTPAVTIPFGANLRFKWRVVSLGSAGTGAVGTRVVIERVAA